MRRTKLRWDYKKLHTDGVRMIKDDGASAMSRSFSGGESITIEQETKVVRKMSRFLEENDFGLFFDVDELHVAIEEARNILQEYDDVHVELENELGTEAYQIK